MRPATFNNLLNRTLDLYRKEKFWEAYNLITDNLDRVPRNDAQLSDFRCSLACRVGRPDLAMDILRESIVGRGAWYQPGYLLEDQDMAPLRSYPDFAGLVELCRGRETAEKAAARYQVSLAPSSDPAAKGRPLIVALHGNMQNASLAQEDWGSFARLGYDMVFIQSSQVTFSNGFVWDDINRGAEDLVEALKTPSLMNEIKGREVVLAGFSAGGRLALYAVLNDLVRVKGLVLVGPWLPEIEEWKSRVPSIKDKVAWTYLVCGDQDPECLPGAKIVDEQLQGAGARSRLRVVSRLDHDYPEDFGTELRRTMLEMSSTR